MRLLVRLFLFAATAFCPLGLSAWREGNPNQRVVLAQASGRFAGHEQLSYRSETTTTRSTGILVLNGMVLRTVERPTGYRIPQALWESLGPSGADLLKEPAGAPLTFRVDWDGAVQGYPDVYAVRTPERVYLSENGAGALSLVRHRREGFVVLSLFAAGLAILLTIGAFFVAPPLELARRHWREACLWLAAFGALSSLAL